MTDSADNTALLGGDLTIYDITELRNFVSNVVTRYYELNEDTYFDTIVQEPSPYDST